MHNLFTDLLKGKTVFVGVGNTLRGDDGLGPFMVELLKERGVSSCINAGEVPENYFGNIVRENPDTVVIIDAVQLFYEPGAYRVLSEEEILETGFSTHTLSPVLFMRRLREVIDGDIFLLGIQPLHIEFGEGLSHEVEQSLHELVRMIVEACS